MDYTQEEKCLIWLQCAPALSWKNADLLLERYKTAERVFADFGPAMRDLIGQEGYRQLEKWRELGLNALTDSLHASGVHAVTCQSDAYPDRLLHVLPPPRVLFVKGTLPDAQKRAVAVIGARRDTRYGRSQAFKIARELAAKGVVIVSGLARGIDSAAHRGALDAGGITIGVLGSGIRKMYPPENQALADEIVRTGGAVISEFAPDAEPIGFHFPIRNRIISGLSDAVLLIEAQKKSGTASTVNHALDQGKEVFALPGNVDAPGSELPLSLLKDGAQICTEAGDILSYMGWTAEGTQTSLFDAPGGASPSADGEADPVLGALKLEEKTFEELLDETGLDVQTLSTRITMLELEGRIESIGGRRYALAQKG